MGLPTVLGLSQKGYFIPYRYAGGISCNAARGTFPLIEDLFRNTEETFLGLLDCPACVEDLAQRFDRAAPPSPRWQQVWFPRLDALAAYLMVRRHKPKRIIEIGSGHSTRFAAAAVEDEKLDTEICAIDPDPRADLSHIGFVTIHRKTLQDIPLSQFERLGENDILMIDSSHIAMPGSDVDILLGRVVPALPKGVLVQIHDIFLPDPYPEHWAWRGYNEQLPVATLLSGGCLEPLWSSHWIATRHAEILDRDPIRHIPILPDVPESSLWLRKL